MYFDLIIHLSYYLIPDNQRHITMILLMNFFYLMIHLSGLAAGHLRVLIHDNKMQIIQAFSIYVFLSNISSKLLSYPRYSKAYHSGSIDECFLSYDTSKRLSNLSILGLHIDDNQMQIIGTIFTHIF